MQSPPVPSLPPGPSLSPGSSGPSLFGVLVRILTGLIAVALIVVLVVVGVPLVIGGVIFFFAFAILFAVWIILRAKVRQWLGLPPKPVLGARARAYRAQRAAQQDAGRENVRVRTPQAAATPPAESREVRPRDIIDAEASPSREAP